MDVLVALRVTATELSAASRVTATAAGLALRYLLGERAEITYHGPCPRVATVAEPDWQTGPDQPLVLRPLPKFAPRQWGHESHRPDEEPPAPSPAEPMVVDLKDPQPIPDLTSDVESIVMASPRMDAESVATEYALRQNPGARSDDDRAIMACAHILRQCMVLKQMTFRQKLSAASDSAALVRSE